jgi:CelD/BcsL family acetyltransferase involved in cellulose biosynthesis
MLMPLTVDTIDNARDFAALQPEWNPLLAASAADCPFLTWEWLHAWWMHLNGSARLQLFVVRDAEEVVAIAPFLIVRHRLGLFQQLEFLGTGFAGSDYLDVIARRGREQESLDAIAQHAETRRLAFHLDHLPPHSVAARLTDALESCGWAFREAKTGICPFFTLAGHSFDSYLATLGPSHRANFRRRDRALQRAFTVQFAHARNEQERREILDTLVALHNRRWERRGGSTAFSTGDLRSFHDDFTRRALAAGWLRLYALRLGDRIAAAIYGFAYNHRFYFYQGAFDEQFAPYSIGLVMMGLTIRAAIDEGACEFDMLYGDETYKSLWARESRPLVRLDLFPGHLGGRLHKQTVDAERTLRTFARRILRRKAPCPSHAAGAVA